MVRDDDINGETLAEAADRHGRAYNTLRNQWSRHPEWPAPIGKHGRSKLYNPAAVDAWVRAHVDRPPVDLERHHLYTARELEDAGIIKAVTIRSDMHHGRWPEPDRTGGGKNRWFGQTVIDALADRRAWGRQTGH